MMSREDSFLAPNGGSGLGSAQQLAKEAAVALVSLDCVKKRRNEAQEQQIKAQEEEILKLSRDKERLEKSLEGNSAQKREHFWREYAVAQATLERKSKALWGLEQSQSSMVKAHDDAIAKLSQKKEKLKQNLQEERYNFANKREHLWAHNTKLQEDLERKKAEVGARDEEIATLSREKERLEEMLHDERRDFDNKSEELWGTNKKLQVALERWKEDAIKLQRSQYLMKNKLEEQQKRVDQLDRQLQSERRRYADAINRLLADGKGAKTERDQLQQDVEQLEKEKKEQNAAFEQERQTWKQRETDNRTIGSSLSSSLEKAMPHLRGLLEAYEQDQGGTDADKHKNVAEEVTEELDTTTSSDLVEQLREQKSAFDRERVQLLEQASDAAKTQLDIALRNLAEREGILTCPISLELFDNPVVTECCGKTFSSSGLCQALARSATCPFCRQRRVVFHANRDVAKLVECHRTERSILGLPESTTLDSDDSASRATGAIAHGSAESRWRREFDRRRANDSNPRESLHREDRLERVRARSEVPHRREAAATNPRAAETTSAVVHRSRAARNQEIRNRIARRVTLRREILNTPPTPSFPSGAELPAGSAASSNEGNRTAASSASSTGEDRDLDRTVSFSDIRTLLSASSASHETSNNDDSSQRGHRGVSNWRWYD